jgi:hypothetical protein
MPADELIPPDMSQTARNMLAKLPDDAIDAMTDDDRDDLAVEYARQLRLVWIAGASAALARCKEIIITA